MNVIEIQNVTKEYANHRALNDVSLKIPKGSIYGLLGPNGAGKTSLIRIINQITAPDSGKVLFNNEELNPNHISKIGYLPEERGLYKKMKVGEQLLYLAQLKGITKNDALVKIKQWLINFDLMNWWDKEVDGLSKGMQQKVQFISTVLHEPELIILDEPFSGFDPINANLIKDEILKLRDNGATIVFSTHRMESVEELCDYICLINKSTKILEGKLDEIKKVHKENKFRIIYESSISQLEKYPESFKVLDFKTNSDGKKEVEIQLNKDVDQAKVFDFFAQQGRVEAYSEIIPSANEIFINTVKSN